MQKTMGKFRCFLLWLLSSMFPEHAFENVPSNMSERVQEALKTKIPVYDGQYAAEYLFLSNTN